MAIGNVLDGVSKNTVFQYFFLIEVGPYYLPLVTAVDEILNCHQS